MPRPSTASNRVDAFSDNSPTGTMPVGTDAEPFPIPTTAPLEPTVVDGHVMLQATLTDAADSAAAEQTVRELREAVDEVDPRRDRRRRDGDGDRHRTTRRSATGP